MRCSKGGADNREGRRFGAKCAASTSMPGGASNDGYIVSGSKKFSPLNSQAVATARN